MMRILATAFLVTTTALGCGGDDESSAPSGAGGVSGMGGAGGTGGSAATGGGGPDAGGSAGTGGTGGSGGTSPGGAGGQGIDCTAYPQPLVGTLGGQALSGSTSTTGYSLSTGEHWYFEHSLNDAYLIPFGIALSWGSDTTGVPAGQGELFAPAFGHYCAMNAHWNEPYSTNPTGTITFESISALGACKASTAPEGTLTYCYLSSYYAGTPPASCPTSGGVRLSGSVSGSPVAVNTQFLNYGGGTTPEQGNFTSAFGPGGFLAVGWTQPGLNEVDPVPNWLLLPGADASSVYCIHTVTPTQVEDDLMVLELGVSKLGDCPGQAVAGSAEMCL